MKYLALLLLTGCVNSAEPSCGPVSEVPMHPVGAHPHLPIPRVTVQFCVGP